MALLFLPSMLLNSATKKKGNQKKFLTPRKMKNMMSKRRKIVLIFRKKRSLLMSMKMMLQLRNKTESSSLVFPRWKEKREHGTIHRSREPSQFLLLRSSSLSS